MVQIVKTPSGEKLAILPLAEYEAMRDARDAAEARAAAAAVAAGAMETLTEEETRALLAAPTPLAFWRARAGLTQAALGRAVGVTQQYIAGLESGARKGDPALFLRIARTLGASMESLVAE